MLAVIFALTIAGYLASITAFYLALVRASTSTSGIALAQRLLAATLLVHLVDIVVRSFELHTCPVLSAVLALSLAGWIAATAFLVWARNGRLLALGVIVAPVALAMLVASHVLFEQRSDSDVPGWFLALHVLANLSAVALFVLGAAASVAYLIQDRRLKSKRLNVSKYAMPGLSSLESLIQRSLGFGLGPMTLGVVSGAVFAERLSHGGMESFRIGLAYSCWFVVATMVVVQRLTGWSGRRVAWGAIVSASLAVAVVVLYAVTAGRHIG